MIVEHEEFSPVKSRFGTRGAIVGGDLIDYCCGPNNPYRYGPDNPYRWYIVDHERFGPRRSFLSLTEAVEAIGAVLQIRGTDIVDDHGLVVGSVVNPVE